MSRRVLAAVAVVLLQAAPAVRAQDLTGWAYKLLATDGKPVSEKDFGTVPKGALLQHRFPMTNIYAVPLAIQTRVSCDCVTVTPSKAVLQPREPGYLDIQMDTRRFNGAKSVTVFMTVIHQQTSASDQYYTSTAILTIKGFCRTDVSLNPGVVNFGIVPAASRCSRP